MIEYVTIPDYQALMLPLLRFAGDRSDHTLREAIDHVSDLFKLTEEERGELLPSGRQAIIDNRVGWAKTYLQKAGLLSSPKRGIFQITDKGLQVLKESPQNIDVKYLERFPGFKEFRSVPGPTRRKKVKEIEAEGTPLEVLEDSYQQLRDELAKELQENLIKVSPDQFEHIVVDLLVKMGYGGSRRDAGSAIGRSGDEGVDGVIKEDKLGLDLIYVQAKRWKGNVGRPVVQEFVGALQGQKARKGILITTSRFTSEAIAYAKSIETRVALIDGEALGQLMIDHDLGVTAKNAYIVKEVDTDYFTQ